MIPIVPVRTETETETSGSPNISKVTRPRYLLVFGFALLMILTVAAGFYIWLGRDTSEDGIENKSPDVSGTCVQEGDIGGRDLAQERCCAGMVPVPNCTETADDCACLTDGSFVCTNCGDGVCGLGENPCTCAEDCGEPSDVTKTSETSSESNDEEVSVDLYFYKESVNTQIDVDDIYPVERQTGADDLYAYVIESIISGPNTDEAAEGYIPVFSLSGTSTCGGSFYEYSTVGTTLKVKICKDIDLEFGTDGAYAGITLAAQSRVLLSFERSLSFGDITRVELYGRDGSCYGPDTGRNTCEWGDEY